MPPECWGYVAINAVDVYNHLPHSALHNKTPWECEKGTTTDVSWFRPFGYSETVYITDHPERLWHGKLAASREECAYLGLGMSHGLKGWLCWNPDIKRIHCTRNVVFEKTFMPLRAHDQRDLGHYDFTPRSCMAATAHCNLSQAAGNGDQIKNALGPHAFEPLEDVLDKELDATTRLPAGWFHHNEANHALFDLEDVDK